MLIHKRDFLADVIVFWAYGAAAGGRGRGRIVFAGEDYEACGVRLVGEGADVGDCGAGFEEGDEGGGVDVGVDVDDWHFDGLEGGQLMGRGVVGGLGGNWRRTDMSSMF